MNRQIVLHHLRKILMLAGSMLFLLSISVSAGAETFPVNQGIHILSLFSNPPSTTLQITRDGDPTYRETLYHINQPTEEVWTPDQADVYHLRLVGTNVSPIKNSVDLVITAENDLNAPDLSGIQRFGMANSLYQTEFPAVEGATWYDIVFSCPESGKDWHETLQIPASGEEMEHIEMTFPADAIYEMDVNARAVGSNSARAKQYLLIGSQEAPEDIQISIDGESGDSFSTIVNCPVEIQVHAPGASAVRMLNENGEWEYIYQNKAIGDLFTFRFQYAEAGRYPLYAQTTYDHGAWEETIGDGMGSSFWEQLNLSWKSRNIDTTLQVQAKGRVTPAEIEILNEGGKVSQNRMFRFRIVGEKAVDHVTRYQVTISAQVDITSRLFKVYSILDEPGEYSFPMNFWSHEPGNHYIEVTAVGEEGYESQTTCVGFLVTKAIENTPFTVDVSKTEGYYMEEISYMITGQDLFRAYIQYGEWTDEHIQPSYFNGTLFLEKGTVPLEVFGYDEAGNEIGHISMDLTGTFLGDLESEAPEKVSMESAYPAGEDITVALPHADFVQYGFTLYNITGDSWERIENLPVWQAKSNAFTIPAAILKADHLYDLQIFSEHPGYGQNFDDLVFLVRSQASDRIHLTIDGSEEDKQQIINQESELCVSAPGATALRLRNFNTWEIISGDRLDADGNYKMRIASFMPETITFIAMATYEESPDLAGGDIQWSEISDPIRFELFSLGKVNSPKIKILNEGNTVVQGEPLQISVTFPEETHSMSMSIDIDDPDENNLGGYSIDPSIEQYSIDTWNLAPGDGYSLSIYCSPETGYEQAARERLFFSVAESNASN